MYINFENLFKLKNPNSVLILLAAKQASKKDMSEYLATLIQEDSELEYLVSEGYLKLIKKGKSDIHKIRLDKKGTAFLKTLSEPDIQEQDIKIAEWLKGVYISKDKQIGNFKKTKMHIASLREETGLELNRLAHVCRVFTEDDEQQSWSYKLEYVFNKPENAFQTGFSLERCRIWKYYEKNENRFKKDFDRLKI